MIAHIEALPATPVVVIRDGRKYLDRHTLAALTGRSVNTIRARCLIAFHEQGKALYDMEACDELLKGIPTRQRAAA